MKTKIIAEIGINHKGSLEIGKRLIDSASSSNCWGIKFQYRNLEKFYGSTDEIGDEIIYDELIRSNLSLNDLKSLRVYAQNKNLNVGISFFTINDYLEIEKYDNEYDFYKIPSAEFSNYDLIKSVSESGKEILISTGGHNLQDIKNNLNSYSFLNNPVILLCTSNYPTEIGNQNLKVLSELSKISNIRVGYSSHDKDYQIVYLAAAFGAEYIERHITEDKNGDGIDDSSSSTIEEFKSITLLLNNLEKIIGNKEKNVNQGEIINLQNLGTSIYAKRDLKIGESISKEDVEIKAPRKGLTFSEFEKLKNKKISSNIKEANPISSYHFKKNKIISDDEINFVNNKNISIPIRFHDMNKIFKEIPINNYEFHLSFKDINNYEAQSVFLNNDVEALYTFHLPDYLDKNTVFNPFSTNKNIKKESQLLIEKTAKFISEFNQEDSLLVSSISQNSFNNKESFYYELKEYIDRLHKDFGIVFLPQWLPKQAWYFGGSFDTEIFSSKDDINFIKKYNIQICLDIAHLIMSANSYGDDWYLWYKELKNNIEHMHLSDAYGTNGEGVDFGQGDLKNIEEFLNLDEIKVLEVWQGHLYNFSGFKEAISYLEKAYN
jgi:N-acetylneuraminate synthase